QHSISLISERLDQILRIFLLSRFPDGALADRRVKLRLKLLHIFVQVLHRVFDILVAHTLLRADVRGAKRETDDKDNGDKESEVAFVHLRSSVDRALRGGKCAQ